MELQVQMWLHLPAYCVLWGLLWILSSIKL